MRISDWSSDVCSSDLWCGRNRGGCAVPCRGRSAQRRNAVRRQRATSVEATARRNLSGANHQPILKNERGRMSKALISRFLSNGVKRRSEEHTSELQSLMRISYAVFCLKKKNIKHHKYMIKDN